MPHKDLHVVTKNGDVGRVRKFLAQGANANVQSPQQLLGIQGEATDVVFPDDADGSVLQVAAQMGRGDIIRLLLEHGANLNITGQHYSLSNKSMIKPFESQAANMGRRSNRWRDWDSSTLSDFFLRTGRTQISYVSILFGPAVVFHPRF